MTTPAPTGIDVERDITYVVEYDEIIHRRCEVTITYDADRTAGSTVNAIEEAVTGGDTDEDYEVDSGTEITSWRPK